MNPLPHHEDPSLQLSIQESLRHLSAELGHPLNQAAVENLYQRARDLLGHTSPAPVTLARVAGALLVYQVQETEAEELEWFNTQMKQCLDEEEVEELIESLHRTDAL